MRAGLGERGVDQFRADRDCKSHRMVLSLVVPTHRIAQKPAFYVLCLPAALDRISCRWREFLTRLHRNYTGLGVEPEGMAAVVSECRVAL